MVKVKMELDEEMADRQSMDKTAVVYIAGAWHNSVTRDISVDKEETEGSYS